MDVSSGEQFDHGMIQHGPEHSSSRVGTLLFLQHLKTEQRRIESELDRINDRLTGAIDDADYTHIDLQQTASELEFLLDKVKQMIRDQQMANRADVFEHDGQNGENVSADAGGTLPDGDSTS